MKPLSGDYGETFCGVAAACLDSSEEFATVDDQTERVITARAPGAENLADAIRWHLFNVTPETQGIILIRPLLE